MGSRRRGDGHCTICIVCVVVEAELDILVQIAQQVRHDASRCSCRLAQIGWLLLSWRCGRREGRKCGDGCHVGCCGQGGCRGGRQGKEIRIRKLDAEHNAGRSDNKG